MYFWTIRLFRAYAYLHRIEHSKSWGREVDEEVVKVANNFAKEYLLSRLPIDFSGAYVETVLDDFNGSRRAFYAFAKAQGYQKWVLLEAALLTKVIQVNAEVKRWSPRYSRQHT